MFKQLGKARQSSPRPRPSALGEDLFLQTGSSLGTVQWPLELPGDMALGTNHKESTLQPSKEARGWSPPDTAGKGKRPQAVFITSLCIQIHNGKLQIPLISPLSHNNSTGFPQVLGTLSLPVLLITRDTSPAPATRLRREGARAPELWTQLIPPAGSCSGHQARKEKVQASLTEEISKARPLSFCKCLLGTCEDKMTITL